MDLEIEYADGSTIPEAFRPLYTEKDGKHVLTGVKGMKTQADIDRQQLGLTKERNDHKSTKEKYVPWSRLTLDGKAFDKPEDVQSLLDELPTLRAAAEAGGSKSQEAVQKLVDAKLATVGIAHKRALDAESAKAQSALARIDSYESRERHQAIKDAALAAITGYKGGKFDPESIEDALMYAERHLECEVDRDENGVQVIKAVRTRDNVGITPGLDPANWITDMIQKRPKWLAGSEGLGAPGSKKGATGGGKNPWSAEHWSADAQVAFYKANGEDAARRAAESVGSSLGATKPMQVSDPNSVRNTQYRMQRR